MKETFPSIRRPRDTYPAFLRVASRTALRNAEQHRTLHHTERQPLKGRSDQEQHLPLFDIENCVNETTGDDGEVVDFSFTCPVLAQNITTLDGQLTEDGLPILFCDICKKKVYTIDGSNPQKLKEAAEMGRCISLDQNAKNTLTNYGSLGNHQRVNIAFVVGNEEEEQLVHDMFRRIHFLRAGSKFQLNAQYHPAFPSKNVLQYFFGTTRPQSWALHIIRRYSRMHTDDGKDETDGPFSAKNSPRGGGWAFLILLDSVSNFTQKAASGTELRALQDSGRVYKYNDTTTALITKSKDRIVREESDDDKGYKECTDSDDDDESRKLPTGKKDDDDIHFSVEDKSKLPEENLLQFWALMEKKIVDEFKMPRHVKGKVAMRRDVRLKGPTIDHDQDSVTSSITSGVKNPISEAKPKKGWLW